MKSATTAKRAELAPAYGTDALVYCAGARHRGPEWLRELPAVEVLRVMLVQNYVITTDARREVIRAREADRRPSVRQAAPDLAV